MRFLALSGRYGIIYIFSSSANRVIPARFYLSTIRLAWPSHCLFFGWMLLTQTRFFTSGAKPLSCLENIDMFVNLTWDVSCN